MKAASDQDQAKWAFFAGVSITAGVALWLWRRQAAKRMVTAAPAPREVMRWEGEGGSLPPDEDPRADVIERS